VVTTSANIPPSPRRATSFEPSVACAFGEVSRSLRVERGVAQDTFAPGVDRSYYGKLERGERQPSLGLLLRIAAALEISGAELVGLVEAHSAMHRRREKHR
jgi:transcriptional regulator with XRE-family HTH domain